MTAHILGGATIGDSAETGVVDAYHRVYGYPGLHVVDGSAVPANLGVNPSLTITAMAERAMSLWPNKGDPDPAPAAGRGISAGGADRAALARRPAHAPAALRLTPTPPELLTFRAFAARLTARPHRNGTPAPPPARTPPAQPGRTAGAAIVELRAERQRPA